MTAQPDRAWCARIPDPVVDAVVVAIAAVDFWLNVWDNSPFSKALAIAGCAALAARRRFPLEVSCARCPPP